MHLHPAAFALAIGIFWSGAVLLTASANALWPPYGQAFLQVIASLYPGYQPLASIRSILIGTAYGFVDGVIGGWIFAWLYVMLARWFPGRTV